MDATDPTPHHALTTQVGGHAGVQTSEDGSLLIKPALPLELEFYQNLSSNLTYAPLRPFIPKFFGTLNLTSPTGEQAEENESIVLENLSHSFSKPNILDVKLGTVLYDESASPEKVERMINTAKKTTSLEMGIRLTGFQVYDNTTNEAVNTPKSYGKSIKASQLIEGIRKFFPTSDSGSGLPSESLLPILTRIRDTVADILDAFSALEIRMVGGSLLIIYEADFNKAKAGINAMENGDFDKPESLDDDNDDDDDDEEETAPPCIVKLIDFAHTRLVPGKGKDDGVCLGIRTTLSLLDQRIQEVKAMLPP